MKSDEMNMGCKKEELKQCSIKSVYVYLDGKLGAVARLQNSPVD